MKQQTKPSRQSKSGSNSSSSKRTSQRGSEKLRAEYQALSQAYNSNWALLVALVKQQGRVRIPLDKLAEVRKDEELSMVRTVNFLTIEVKDVDVSVPDSAVTQ